MYMAKRRKKVNETDVAEKMWAAFSQTGDVGLYLLYRSLKDEDDLK